MKFYCSIILLFLFICFISAKNIRTDAVFPTDSKFIYDACLSKHGKVIVCTDNNSLKVFSVEKRVLRGSFTNGHRNKILCVALSNDSSLLASGGSDSTVVLWDFATHEIVQRITFATGKITSIKFSPNNQFVLFGCSNSRAYLYNIEERKIAFEFTDQRMDVTSVAFSHDGNLIAIAGADRTIRIYNSIDYNLNLELKKHTSWIRSVCFYNDGKNLISCGDDRRIIQWNLSNANYKKFKIYNSWTLSIDIENNSINRNNLFVSGTMSGSITINYAFGSYRSKVDSPVNKVLIIPNESRLIEIVAATLGSGLLYISADQMQFTK